MANNGSNGDSRSYAFRRSISQLRTYRMCGRKWLLSYGIGWHAIRSRGTYRFGDVMQQVADAILGGIVPTGQDAAAFFREKWAPFATDPTLTWTTRASWKLLNDRGAVLAAVMAEDLPLRIDVHAPLHLNERLEFTMGDVPFLGFPDFYGAVQRFENGVWQPGYAPTVLDWKTSDREYNAVGVELDGQLTSYQLGELTLGRPVGQVGLCVLLYSAQPRIQWLLVPARTTEERAAFVADVEATDAQIRAESFPRNERACFAMGECDFTPICFASQAGRQAAELVQQAPESAVDVLALDRWSEE